MIHEHRDPRAAVPLSVVTDFGTAHIQYRRLNGALIPSLVHRAHFPWVRGRRTTFHYESHACNDSSGDGLPELLQVALITQQNRGQPKQPKRAHFFAWRGIVPKLLNGQLDQNSKQSAQLLPAYAAEFPAAVEIPRDLHLGLPIELEPIRVEPARKPRRLCLFFRPWNVGIFIEPARRAG